MNSVAACAGTDVWTSLGPDGGLVGSLVIDPRNSQTVYALTLAGLSKSTDGGSNWSATAPLPAGSGRIVSIVIDPQNTNVLYAANNEFPGGARGDGVFKS